MENDMIIQIKACLWKEVDKFYLHTFYGLLKKPKTFIRIQRSSAIADALYKLSFKYIRSWVGFGKRQLSRQRLLHSEVIFTEVKRTLST